MRLEFKKLKKLPVETEKNGIALGQIINMELDTRSHQVIKYFVVKRRFLSKSPRLFLSPSQIVRIEADKIVVQDNIEESQIKQIAKQPVNLNKAPTTQAEMKK